MHALPPLLNSVSNVASLGLLGYGYRYYALPVA